MNKLKLPVVHPVGRINRGVNLNLTHRPADKLRLNFVGVDGEELLAWVESHVPHKVQFVTGPKGHLYSLRPLVGKVLEGWEYTWFHSCAIQAARNYVAQYLQAVLLNATQPLTGLNYEAQSRRLITWMINPPQLRSKTNGRETQ